ncbi:MAG: NCS2 family permease [Rhodospirillaceae bacterium]|nr:MAG: NCS2 family permease [Rhodospirillaceae bacterium]
MIQPAIAASRQFLESYFEFGKHNARFITEFVAGITTYISLSYIFILNPVVLSTTGMPGAGVLFATVVVSALATLAMGLWAKLPFAVGPGLEMNGYFAIVICGVMKVPWQEALGIVCLSGIFNLVFTYFQVRKSVVDLIPAGLKRAMASCVGGFVATIGLKICNIVSYKNNVILDLGAINRDRLFSHEALILYFSLATCVILRKGRIVSPFAIIISVVVGVFLSVIWQVPHETAGGGDYLATVGKLNFNIFRDVGEWKYAGAILVLFLIDFLGGAGKIIGLTAATNIQSKGVVPHYRDALFVDGGATILGSIMGTSSMVAFVESATGIELGGRTGFTAVVCALLIASTAFAFPVVNWIPVQAVSGVLVYVAYLLLPWKIDPTGAISHTRFDYAVGFIMAIVAFLTFGIDKAMAIGFVLYFLHGILRKVSLKELWLLGIIGGVLSATAFAEYFIW